MGLTIFLMVLLVAAIVMINIFFIRQVRKINREHATERALLESQYDDKRARLDASHDRSREQFIKYFQSYQQFDKGEIDRRQLDDIYWETRAVLEEESKIVDNIFQEYEDE